MSKKILPYCKEYPGAFIEFTGLVTPCCWFVTTKKRHDLLEEFMGEDYNKLFITQPKEEIIKIYKKIEDTWETDSPYYTCLDNCGEETENHPLKRKIQEQNPYSRD